MQLRVTIDLGGGFPSSKEAHILPWKLPGRLSLVVVSGDPLGHFLTDHMLPLRTFTRIEIRAKGASLVKRISVFWGFSKQCH